MTRLKHKRQYISIFRQSLVVIALGLCISSLSVSSKAFAQPISDGNTPATTAPSSGSSTAAANCSQATGCLIDPQADPATTCTASSCDLFKKYFNPTIDLLSALVGIAVTFSIIAGGIQYTTSAGDPQKAAKAKAHLYNAVLALIAFIFLFAFIQWIVPGGLLNKS